jgi:23S rRNA G2445 N2-methylase RlmL
VQGATQRAKAGLDWVNTPNESHPQQNNCVIMCNELHPGAAALARNTISNAGLAKVISLSAETNACDWVLPPGKVVEGRTIMTSNPPWGIRLDGAEEVESSWVALQDFMRRECVGAEAWVLSGDKSLTKLLCMKRTRRIPIQTGEQDLRWIQYHVFPKAPPRDDREPLTNEQMEPSISSTPPKQTQEIN